jgi:general stress protein CsbA
MTDILEYLLTAILFFLLYLVVRHGITGHRFASLLFGIIFIAAGLTIQQTDGELLIFSGLIIFILAFVSKDKTEGELS